jgi:hypothetical protein
MRRGKTTGTSQQTLLTIIKSWVTCMGNECSSQESSSTGGRASFAVCGGDFVMRKIWQASPDTRGPQQVKS